MKKLSVYLKPYKRESLCAPAFKMLEALLELFVPLVVAAMIDTGIANGDRAYIIQKGILLAVLAAAGLLFSVTAQYFAAKAATGFSKDVRHALFSHIQSLSYKELDRLGVSTLITRLTSDMNQVQSGLNMTLRLLLRSPFVVFGAMVMAFTVDVKAALLFVLIIPILTAVIFGIMALCVPLYKGVQQHLDREVLLTRENLSGARVLRAFCKEEQEEQDFRQANVVLTRLQNRVGAFSALMNPATYILINIAIVLLIYSGALRVQAGLLTQGAVVALYNYMSQILVELIKLANLVVNITKSIACGNRIEAVLEEKNSLSNVLPACAEANENPDDDCAVRFCHASLRYSEKAAEALQDIDFSVRRGETIGVIGGTGCGKSSLVNLIPRFYDVTEGSVLVDGRDVRRYPLDKLRGKIGVVPQKAMLFHGTLRENLLWGDSNADDSTLMEALRTAQAESLLKDKPEGLDFLIEQNGRNLSGGQRQRVTIARALVRRPSILILDDSSSALDFATEAALRKALRSLPDTITVFLVSQRISSLLSADRIVVLEDGRITGLGTHTELLKSCPAYQEIYSSQFKKEGEQA